jgi:hypothetical protein
MFALQGSLVDAIHNAQSLFAVADRPTPAYAEIGAKTWRQLGGNIMRTTYPVQFWLWLLIVMATPTLAQEKPVTVGATISGTDNPNIDLQAVQSAVDQGGRVSLKGIFDFGETGSVTITKDVEIVGPIDDPATPRPKIKHGHVTFKSVQPAPPLVGPKITIRNIEFEGASWTPIYIAHASGVTIVGNKISQVRPVLYAPEGRKPFRVQHGIVIGTWLSLTLNKREPYQADAVTGIVRIEENDIELTNDEPTNTMGLGTLLIQTTGVTANIARNTIRNASRNCIEALDNYRASNGSGWIVIADNQLETPAEGIPLPAPMTPNGIMAGYFLDPSAATDPSRATGHMILHNSLRAHGRTSWGIGVLLDGALVRDNYVAIEGSESAGIVSTGSQVYIGQNRVEGTGVAAVRLTPYASMSASDSELNGNDFETFKASTADVVLGKGATNNHIDGRSGSIVDGGAGNQATGLRTVSK